MGCLSTRLRDYTVHEGIYACANERDEILSFITECVLARRNLKNRLKLRRIDEQGTKHNIG